MLNYQSANKKIEKALATVAKILYDDLDQTLLRLLMNWNLEKAKNSLEKGDQKWFTNIVSLIH